MWRFMWSARRSANFLDDTTLLALKKLRIACRVRTAALEDVVRERK